MGIGDWGLGIWGWGFWAIPPHPKPKPQQQKPKILGFFFFKKIKIINKI